MACAALGESQRTAQRRARVALAAAAVARREELESEVVRRRAVEAALRQREGELVAAQRETAEALARLNAFLDNAPLGIAFFDPELRFVRINPYLAAVSGKPVEEHTGRTLPEVLPDFPPEVLAAYRRTATDEGVPFTTQIRRPNLETGGARVWQVNAFPVREPAGKAVGAGVIAQDVTDRLRAEEDLRRSERNLSDFFENANVGLHWVGPDGVITRANKAELELLGYGHDEYVGHPVAEFHDDPDTICDILARLSRGDRLDNYPARLRCKDGTIRDVLISSSVLWEDGRFIHSRCFTRDVTELKRVTEAMRESEERFRSMADSAPALIWLSDLEGRRDYFNRTWLEFTGRTVEQEGGYGWADNIHPDDRARYLGAYASAFAGRRPFELEYRLRRRDGADRWVLARGTPRFTPSGGFAGFVGLCLDVTERREAGEAVRQSDAFRRSVFDSSPDCLKIMDLGGRVLEINEAACRLLELDDPGSLSDALWADLWPAAEPRDGSRGRGRRPRRRRRAVPGVLPDCQGDGEVLGRVGGRGARRRRAPVPADRGVPGRDRASRRAEDAVRASEQRFRTLTEAVPQMVWTTDPAGALTFVNRRWEDYTGAAPAPGADVWDIALVHPEDAAAFRTGWQKAVAAQAADDFSDEFRLRRAPTEPTGGCCPSPCRCAIRPGRSSSGLARSPTSTIRSARRRRSPRWCASGRRNWRRNAALSDEVEERKAAEEQVRAVAGELARSNDELEKFAYVASHDLQEPLRKIQAFGDRLRNKCREQLPENGREYVDRMLSAAGRMRRLIDDLLTFSRVTTQKRPFRRVDLNKLLREVVSDLDVRITQADGTVRVGPLPTIAADPTQMQQLFQNLIANAVKFHRPGVPPVVEVSGEFDSRPPANPGAGDPIPEYRLTVRDNGIGFDDKYRDRIFDVFQRLHRRDQYEGTGVGLAICRKIVERHGGTITAHSREGDGATFVVVLPARQPTPREVTAADVQPEQADYDTDGRRRPGRPPDDQGGVRGEPPRQRPPLRRGRRGAARLFAPPR